MRAFNPESVSTIDLIEWLVLVVTAFFCTDGQSLVLYKPFVLCIEVRLFRVVSDTRRAWYDVTPQCGGVAQLLCVADK